MHTNVYVAGFPSVYGGADTELDHTLDLLLEHGISITLVPFRTVDTALQQKTEQRGLRIAPYSNRVFVNQTVISYCNGSFLRALPTIARCGPPRKVIWLNCMTRTFPDEVLAHREGWIDCFGFQTEYQESLIRPVLEKIRPVTTFPYRPYVNISRMRWAYRDWHGTYNVGRISRDDPAKFSRDTWRIFDRILVPRRLKKKVFILGYGRRAAQKLGKPPPGLDWMTWPPRGIETDAFFARVDTMVHKTGGSRENYPRVLVEAYSYGTVPIVEDDYAFPRLVQHGITGFRTSCSDEMSYYASWLAGNPSAHRRMAEKGRAYLDDELNDREASWRGWETVLGP